MKSRRRLVVVSVVSGLLSALVSAASGQTPLPSSDKLAQLAAGQGRIYFYRNSSRAPLVQPAVKLNGKVVGSAKPDAAFFVDRSPGEYEVQASSEEPWVAFSLGAGEEKFVRLMVTLGLIGGTVRPELVSKEIAQSEMKDLALSQPEAKP